MKTVRMRTAVALSVLAVFPGPVAAQEDSTSVQEVDVPWQAPSYATTSGYANNAGQLGGQGLDWVRNNGLYSSNAGSVNASGITGIASCASGYALKKVAGGFTCVNQVSGADVAASVDASGITGIASCASGYALSKVDGGFTCVNDAGGGRGAGWTTVGGCNGGYSSTQGSYWGWSNPYSCWGDAGWYGTVLWNGERFGKYDCGSGVKTFIGVQPTIANPYPSDSPVLFSNVSTGDAFICVARSG